MSNSRQLITLKSCLLGKSNTFWSSIRRNHSEQTNQSYSAKSRYREAYEEKRRHYEEGQTSNPLESDSLISDQNHYQRLNIQQDSTQDEVKSAYYSLSKIYHPDAAGKDHPNASENFRLITESYDILNDPTKRQTYDETLSFSPPASWPSHKGTTSDTVTNEYNHNVFYRTRHADRIIRRRQEAYMRAEMEKNPKKFQAGSFDRQTDGSPSFESLATMEKRLKNLNSTQFGSTRWSSSDGSDFYKQHLHQTLYRRAADMRIQTLFSSWPQKQCDFENSPFIPSLIVIALLSCCTILYFVNIDIPAYVDEQLVAFSKKDRGKE